MGEQSQYDVRTRIESILESSMSNDERVRELRAMFDGAPRQQARYPINIYNSSVTIYQGEGAEREQGAFEGPARQATGG